MAWVLCVCQGEGGARGPVSHNILTLWRYICDVREGRSFFRQILDPVLRSLPPGASVGVTAAPFVMLSRYVTKQTNERKFDRAQFFFFFFLAGARGRILYGFNSLKIQSRFLFEVCLVFGHS